MSWRGFTIRQQGAPYLYIRRARLCYKLEPVVSGRNRVETWTSRKINPSIINKRKEQISQKKIVLLTPVPRNRRGRWYFILRPAGQIESGKNANSSFPTWIISLYIIMRNNGSCDLQDLVGNCRGLQNCILKF